MEAMGVDPIRHLRSGFDLVAEDYQHTKSVCPSHLFDDLLHLAGLKAGDRVLEIGCCTGQATVPFAERGLAAIARRRMTGFPAAQVVTGSMR